MSFYFRYPESTISAVTVISGNLIADQGVPAALSDAWPIKISDGASFAALLNIGSSQALFASPGQSLSTFSVIAGWDGASHRELLTDASGRLQIGSITGTVSLPTGASTSALQTTGNASLASIDGKLANDYGISSGAVRTASQIGNATGAADFGAGTTSAQTLRTVIVSDQSTIPVSISPGTFTADQGSPAVVSDAWPIRLTDAVNSANLVNVPNAQSIVATPGFSLPTVAIAHGWDGTSHRELLTDASGQLLVGGISGTISLPTGASTSALQTSGNASLASIDGKLANNYGVSSGAIRTASQIGNATGAADFGAGTTSAQTLRAVIVSDQSVIPVSVSGGTAISNQGTPAALSDAWPIKLSDGVNFATLRTIGNSQAVVATPGQSLSSLSVMVGWDGANHRELLTDSTGLLLIGGISGTISLPTGAATSALQTTGNASLASIDGKLVNGYGAAAGALRSAAQIGNATGAADFGVGNASAQTLRIVFAADQAALPAARGRALANAPARIDYTSINVTTAAYTQLVASTSLATNMVEVFDSSGQTLVFAVGGAGVEVIQFNIFPGGNGQVPLAIPAGSRVAIRALTATANTGEIDVNFYT